MKGRCPNAFNLVALTEEDFPSLFATQPSIVIAFSRYHLPSYLTDRLKMLKL